MALITSFVSSFFIFSIAIVSISAEPPFKKSRVSGFPLRVEDQNDLALPDESGDEMDNTIPLTNELEDGATGNNQGNDGEPWCHILDEGVWGGNQPQSMCDLFCRLERNQLSGQCRGAICQCSDDEDTHHETAQISPSEDNNDDEFPEASDILRIIMAEFLSFPLIEPIGDFPSCSSNI